MIELSANFCNNTLYPKGHVTNTSSYSNYKTPAIDSPTYTVLKEFQSLENDVCHTVVFGNVATVVASC